MLPQLLVKQISNISKDSTDEKPWNGVWNSLLVEFFPWNEGWVVTPLSPSPANLRKSIGFVVMFTSKHNHATIPAVFVELEPFSQLRLFTARSALDAQMRDVLVDYVYQGPAKLIGLSAFGHMVCKYEATTLNDKYKIIPLELPESTQYLYDTVPKERWDLDLLTDEGGDRLVAIIKEVKNMVLAEIANRT